MRQGTMHGGASPLEGLAVGLGLGVGYQGLAGLEGLRHLVLLLLEQQGLGPLVLLLLGQLGTGLWCQQLDDLD